MFNLIFWFKFFTIIFIVSATCPEHSIKWRSKCFLFISDSAAFIPAEEDCAERGGHLASIHDKFTNMYLAQEAARYITTANVTDFWIGATNMQGTSGKWSGALNVAGTDDTWSWTDGTPFDFSDWRDTKPPNTQSCGVLSFANGIWIADDCYRFKPYVCELDASPLPLTTTTTYLPTTTTTVPDTTTTTTVFTTTPSTTDNPTAEPVTTPTTKSSTEQPTTTTTTTGTITADSTTERTTPYYTTTTTVQLPTSTVTGNPSTELSPPPTTMPTNGSTILPPLTSTSPNKKCDSNSTFYNGSCWFKAPTDNWSSAEQYCKDNGGHLASIHSEEDIKFINSTFASHINIWIGLTSNYVVSQTWKWSDNTTVDYTPWIDQQDPNIPTACASLFGDGFSHNILCFGEITGICKKFIF